jgi:hypothetical protein
MPGILVNFHESLLSQFWDGDLTKAPRSVIPADLLLSHLVSNKRPLSTKTAAEVYISQLLSGARSQQSKKAKKSRSSSGINSINAPTSPEIIRSTLTTSLITPISFLTNVVRIHNELGVESMTDLFMRLTAMVQHNLPTLPEPSYGNKIKQSLWKSPAAAAGFISFLVAPRPRLHEAMSFTTDTRQTILITARTTPSASLCTAFRSAKALAITKNISTVLVISLEDLRYLELLAAGDNDYSTFSHIFTLGIGAEGVVIWQSWRPCGYSFDEYISRGGARIRTWHKAEEFVADFEKLTSMKVC